MATYELDGYLKSLDQISSGASKDFEMLLSLRGEFTDIDSFRAFLDEQTSALLDKYGTAASGLAAEQYDAWREQILGDPFGASTVDIEDTKTWGLSHQLKEADKGNKGIEEAESITLNRFQAMLDRRIKDAARDTIRANSKRDDKSIGCASVPQGKKPCAFCLEMAALGVTESFKIMDIEGRIFHDHCNCVFVPGFIGHSVTFEHYNSDAIRNALDSVKRTLGYPINAGIKPEWERAIRAELDRRDQAWVMNGIEPEIGKKDGANPNKEEIATAQRLKEHGIGVDFYPSYNEYKRRRADVILRNDGYEWEIKQSKGIGKSNIRNKFNEAVDGKTGKQEQQSDRLIIDISWHQQYGGLPLGEIEKRTLEELRKREDFKETILIGDSGYIKRYKK